APRESGGHRRTRAGDRVPAAQDEPRRFRALPLGARERRAGVRRGAAGRGAAEILGSETIDPEVPFLIGKDTNDMRDMIRGLEVGSEPLGLVALRDPDAKSMLADLKKQFGEFEKNVSPILRELQKLVSARQASAQLVSASEQLQGSVAKLQ